MPQPVTDDTTSNSKYQSSIWWVNTGDECLADYRMKPLRINCLLPTSISRFTGGGATSSNTDKPKVVLDLVTSDPDPESPYIQVSPSGSSSSWDFVAPPVAPKDLPCESDPPSSPTQLHLKIVVDFNKYHNQPRDLTHYITRTEQFACGKGGSSDVWKCKWKTIPPLGIDMPSQDVAVKAFRVLSSNSDDMKKLIKKLRQEVFLWQKLKHSHIITLYGIAEDFSPIPALVCPWMENGTLQEYLKKLWKEQLSPKMDRLFLLLFQVVLGLQYLHYKNIIHGDLTPMNVLIDKNENALLADFGLSRLLGDHETSFFKSHGPGAIRWAAPEIILNLEMPGQEVGKPNEASDIYSFGCIMMQVLSAKLPYYDIANECLVIVAKSRGILPTRPPAIDNVYWCYIERCFSPCDSRPLVAEVLEYIEAEYERQKFQ
ncbi:kinase-like protein [Suillus decipiens]|nr:kinase-like protein [Suillus decipiens]